MYSDSSPDEVVSDVVADEYPLTRKGNDFPLDKKKQSATVPESGSRGRNATKPQGVSNPYAKSLQNLGQDLKQSVLGGASDAENAKGRAPQLEIGSTDHWSSSQDAPNAMSVVQGQPTEVRSFTDVTTTDEFEAMSSVGQSYGAQTLTSESRTNGNLLAGEFQQLQTSHVQRAHPDSGLESMPDASNNHHPDIRRLRIHEPGAEMVVGNIGSGSSRKLQWKVRDSDSGDDATSSGAASTKGISEDEEGGSHESVKASPVSIKETTSVEYKVQRSWKTVRSRGGSISSEDRGSLDEQQSAAAGQQHLVRAPSDGSEKAIDMYENSAHTLDYDPSDTSSTTMDEAESNGGGGVSGRFSGEMDRQPPAVFDQGSVRPVPRPNLPRSATVSSRGSFPSEESSSYGSPSRIEMASPDHHLDNVRINVGPRRHSWDERTLSRMGAGAAGHTGPHQGPTSVRSKSSSQDFGGGQTDLQRMSSVPADSGSRLPANRTRQVPSSPMYDNFRQSSPYGLRSPQPLWVNRYVPPSQSIQQQWSPNSPHRPYFAEPSPLHPLQSRLAPSLRQIPGGQLPPKQGLYPPLPPPGALPHVLCQHCGLLLAVPENLPPNPKGTQKLRCGSCRKISTFSVPQAECPIALQVSVPSGSDSEQSLTLLASSPDSQTEFRSNYSTVGDSLSASERQRSGRRYSVSDAAQKQVQARLVRKHSLGNEDSTDADEDEIVETALSERVEALAIDSAASSPSSSIPLTGFRSPPVGLKSSQPGEIGLSTNDHPYQKAEGGPYPRFNSIPQNAHAGDSVPAEEKLASEISLSDSESEYAQRSLSATSSPRVNQSNSRSPSSSLPNYQDPRSSGRAAEEPANEQVHYEAPRGLNKTLNRIFIFRKSKQGGAVHYRRKVVVNGVPIPDHLVKKAEEQAGPIHPGTYWYDVQAGFWGVAGGQCLGIIPPFIEEFSYPMTRDCSAGRTGIFVNGRELHHMDREKLCSRGLPDTAGMSYRIEIDGRVVEEATGSELRSLGRLAPSLERSGRGAGMHVPPNISGGRS